LNPDLLKAVVDVNATADALGIKVVLVGALMMEFTAEIRPDYPQPKKTNDADFALFVESWDSFNSLRAALEAKGYPRHPKIEHRLANASKTIMIDLIPIGAGIETDGKIVWPESEQVMTVIGFPEVCAATATEVREGLPKVPVITVPGFVLLKIIAFQERFENGDPKYANDVEHLAYWFEHYASISNKDERRFALITQEGWADLDVNFAGAALLGREVRPLCSAEALVRIHKFIQDSIDPYSKFIETLLRQRRAMSNPEGLRAEAIDWLKAFQRGLDPK
jgi:predicted nucleotidyltransferase